MLIVGVEYLKKILESVVLVRPLPPTVSISDRKASALGVLQGFITTNFLRLWKVTQNKLHRHGSYL
jgi:hypothetical protein